MENGYKIQIDPGLCPICKNPICTNVPFTCSEVCIYSLKSGCYQLGGNPQDYGTCECSYDDIIEVFGETFEKGHLNHTGKGHKLAEIMIRNIQHGKSLLLLPDDLFEI